MCPLGGRGHGQPHFDGLLVLSAAFALLLVLFCRNPHLLRMYSSHHVLTHSLIAVVCPGLLRCAPLLLTRDPFASTIAGGPATALTMPRMRIQLAASLARNVLVPFARCSLDTTSADGMQQVRLLCPAVIRSLYGFLLRHCSFGGCDLMCLTGCPAVRLHCTLPRLCHHYRPGCALPALPRFISLADYARCCHLGCPVRPAAGHTSTGNTGSTGG